MSRWIYSTKWRFRNATRFPQPDRANRAGSTSDRLSLVPQAVGPAVHHLLPGNRSGTAGDAMVRILGQQLLRHLDPFSARFLGKPLCTGGSQRAGDREYFYLVHGIVPNAKVFQVAVEKHFTQRAQSMPRRKSRISSWRTLRTLREND